MRPIHILSGCSLFACLLAFCGCSTDELPGMEPTDGNGSAAPFTISVSDGGYASSDADPHTRAAENGYQTTFTAGDQIGVFAVKDGAIVSGINNLCLTAANNNGSLIWQDGNGKAPLNIPGATYYAYYPYRQPLTGNLVPSASDAAGFFTNVISNWTPATDQSTYTKYTAQDLMIAKGTLSGKSLSFSMAHQMALVVIDLPRTKYTFTNTNPTVPEYIIYAPDTKFTGFSPCCVSGGTYRYLVKPNSGSGNLSGSYTASGSTKIWSFSPSSVSAGNYKVFKVDGAKVTEISHTLQAGDFYMSDGSLLAGSTATLTDAQKQACVGVVFWVGDATAKDKTLKTDHSGCTHGLVVALKNAIDGTTTWQAPWTSVQDWLNNNRSGQFLLVKSGYGSGAPLHNIQGYNNTKAIEAFNAANSGYVVQAVQKAVDYRKTVAAPATSSDWYLPSAKELTLLCGREVSDIWRNQCGTAMRDLLNGTTGPFQKLGNYAETIQTYNYWSSTESIDDAGYYQSLAFYVNFEIGFVSNQAAYKGSYFRVRCVLAF